MQEEKKKYLIGKHKFTLRDLSLKEDRKLALIIDEVFGEQQNQMDKTQKKTSDVPFIETRFINDSIIITGGFLSKLLETNAAVVIAEMVLVPEDSFNKSFSLHSLLWRFRFYRLNWLSKHIKGDLKARIFTDFFSEGTVYASSLVNHFLILLSSRIAHLEESKRKEVA